MNKKRLLFEYFAERMAEHTDIDKEHISYFQARFILGNTRLPKWLHNSIINTMIEYKFLNRECKRRLKINK